MGEHPGQVRLIGQQPSADGQVRHRVAAPAVDRGAVAQRRIDGDQHAGHGGGPAQQPGQFGDSGQRGGGGGGVGLVHRSSVVTGGPRVGVPGVGV
ncbi:hypothetical protein GCM10017673_58330 [Streptosporangium violaceochromogenes]|nr:hypothetical protein GCM10017673_58330 [Streptosporangium violaceochromogenes]